MNLTLAFTSLLFFAVLGHRHYRSSHDQVLTRSNALHQLWRLPVSLLIISALGLGIRILSEHNSFASRLPLYPQIYSLESFLYALLGLTAYTSTLLIHITFREKRDRITTLLAIFFITGSIIFVYSKFTHEVHEKLQVREKDGIILQSDPMSCASASFANIARFHGIELSEKEAARLQGTTVLGTMPAQIALAAQKLNFKTNIFYKKTYSAIALPAIIYVDTRFGKEAHAIVLASLQADHVEVWDPDKGRQAWSYDLLKKRWHGNGISMMPNDN
jgi:predicted double-glycine peptidase